MAAVLEPLCPRFFRGVGCQEPKGLEASQINERWAVKRATLSRDDGDDDVEPVNGEMIVDWGDAARWNGRSGAVAR